MTNSATSYLERHNNSNFEIGDIVRVTRKAQDYEEGWQNNWGKGMDSTVGHIGTIIKDAGEHGFVTKIFDGTEDHYRCFPYMILEKVL